MSGIVDNRKFLVEFTGIRRYWCPIDDYYMDGLIARMWCPTHCLFNDCYLREMFRDADFTRE
jgi:hypothetical protein